MKQQDDYWNETSDYKPPQIKKTDLKKRIYNRRTKQFEYIPILDYINSYDRNRTQQRLQPTQSRLQQLADTMVSETQKFINLNNITQTQSNQTTEQLKTDTEKLKTYLDEKQQELKEKTNGENN